MMHIQGNYKSTVLLVMFCHMLGAMPVPETLMTWSHLDQVRPGQWYSSQNAKFFSKKMHSKYRPQDVSVLDFTSGYTETVITAKPLELLGKLQWKLNENTKRLLNKKKGIWKCRLQNVGFFHWCPDISRHTGLLAKYNSDYGICITVAS